MTAALQAQPPAAVARSALVPSVPFFAQEDYQCGPAALAMTLAADGVPVTPEALVPEVYLPARSGSLQAEMLATARRHGRLAVVLPARLDAVLAEVNAGRPVIVLQNLSLPVIPLWHYAVVIGYDLAQQQILLHSGTTARQRLPMSVFERTWARSGHWAMVTTRPDALPVSPDAATLLAASAALERIDAGSAASAYAALTRRDPGFYGAWFGLGNARHAGGDLAGAQQAFSRATEIDPRAADAWNNLALTQLALRRTGEARTAAQRALALGGPSSARYRQTMDAIERAGGS
ncbi:MAG: PA2778 family cysteine peptidase [Burkholderiaceae bacterium]|nr:PA2778 family cysteine peptidase [Burkholderiaceae bacterium]